MNQAIAHKFEMKFSILIKEVAVATTPVSSLGASANEMKSDRAGSIIWGAYGLQVTFILKRLAWIVRQSKFCAQNSALHFLIGKLQINNFRARSNEPRSTIMCTCCSGRKKLSLPFCIICLFCRQHRCVRNALVLFSGSNLRQLCVLRSNNAIENLVVSGAPDDQRGWRKAALWFPQIL